MMGAGSWLAEWTLITPRHDAALQAQMMRKGVEQCKAGAYLARWPQVSTMGASSWLTGSPPLLPPPLWDEM